MKISAYKHTELLKDPSKPFRIELPATAMFRTALLAAGQPQLIVGASTIYPIIIMSFSFDPENTEKDVRWYQMVGGAMEFTDAQHPVFMGAMWEQVPDQHGRVVPSPVLLYEVKGERV